MEYSAIVIHHTKSPDHITRDWDSIKHYHTSWRYKDKIISPLKAHELIRDGEHVEKPWNDIGYNYGIENINNDITLKFGRSLYIPGAHCIGMNDKSIGIAFIGDFDDYPPSIEHYKVGGILCAMLINRFPQIDIEAIYPHNHFNLKKTCPGKYFDMSILKSEVRKNLR